MQFFFMVGGRGHKLFCEHQRHKPVRGGWRYKARFVFALLLCDFLHSEKIFVIFCTVFFSSLRISALPCQQSDLVCCCQLVWKLGHNSKKEHKYWIRKIV